MKLTYSFALVTCFVLAASSPVAATNVLQNTSAVVGSLGGLDLQRCDNFDISETKIIKQPDHGRIDFEKRTVTALFGRCHGKQLPVVQVIYTPRPGFIGTDDFSFEAKYSNFLAYRGRPVRKFYKVINVH